MGCDIHPHYEVRKDCKWEHVQVRAKYVTGGKEEDGDSKIDYDGYFNDPLYIGRNYDLFAILANVRNGSGFAGCDTGDGFRPIMMPRGVPRDASLLTMEDYTVEVNPSDGFHTREKLQQWVDDGISKWIGKSKVSGPDWHSASYLTLRELLDYDWEQTAKH